MDKTLCDWAKRFKYAKDFLLIFLLIFLLTSGVNDDKEVRILFTGDLLLSRNVNIEIQSRKNAPWCGLLPLFKSADFIAGNLEGAVGNKKDCIFPSSDLPVFAIDSSSVPLLKAAGFSAVSIANNHSADLGEKGKIRTLETLRNDSIVPISLENSPQFFTIKDITFSLIAINMVPSRDSLKDKFPSVEIEQKLRLAVSLSNLVIVSIHWGSELLDWPNREQREATKWLIEHGADLIIGSHPHVIQKPEIVEGKPVYFSLGNHLFDQKYPATKQGMIADIRIKNGKFFCSGIITHTTRNSFFPIITDTIDLGFDSICYRKNLLKINNCELKPFSIYRKGNDLTIIKAFKEGKPLWESPALPLVTLDTCKLDGKKEYLFALEKRYSNLDKQTSLRPYVYSVDYNGIIARWRGSALAWPLIDAKVSPLDNRILCALHRGDSFIRPDVKNSDLRVAVYKWNGFGFEGIDDTVICKTCNQLMNDWIAK